MPDYTIGDLLRIASQDDPERAKQISAGIFGVSQDLSSALERQESGGRQAAFSPKGAIGRYQLMPRTATGMNLDPHNEYENIWGGHKYLSQQMTEFQEPRLALAAYNAGPDVVRKYGDVPPYKETQQFVKNVLGGEKKQKGGYHYTVEDLQELAGMVKPPKPKPPNVYNLTTPETPTAAAVRQPSEITPEMVMAGAPEAAYAGEPLIGRETLGEIGAAAKEMVFGGPRSVMIPEERYQEVAKEAGMDVHPGWTKPLEMVGSQLWGGAKQGIASLVELNEKLAGGPPPLTKNLHEGLKKMLEVPPEQVGTDLASQIIRGLGSAPAGVLKFGGALMVGGYPGVAALGAVEAPGGIREKLGGAAGNVLLAGALGLTKGMASLPRAGAMGAIGGAQAATVGGGAQEITADAVVMAVLGLTPGGKKLKKALDTDAKPAEIGAKEWKDVKEAVGRLATPKPETEVPPQPPEPPPTAPKPEPGVVTAPEAKAPPAAGEAAKLPETHAKVFTAAQQHTINEVYIPNEVEGKRVYEWYQYKNKKGENIVIAKFELEKGGSQFNWIFPDGTVANGGTWPESKTSISKKFPTRFPEKISLHEGLTVRKEPPTPAPAKEALGVTQRPDRYTTPPEPTLDSLATNLESLSNIVKTDSFKKQGFGSLEIPAQRNMLGSMLSALHQHEIRNAVIKTIPVDVVDNLTRVQSSADVSLHDKSVLKEPFTINPDNTVTLRIDTANSLVRAIAGFVTEQEGRPSTSVRGATQEIRAVSARDRAGGLAEKPPTIIGAEEKPGLVLPDGSRLPEDVFPTDIARDIRKGINIRHIKTSDDVLDRISQLTGKSKSEVLKDYPDLAAKAKAPLLDESGAVDLRLLTPGLESATNMKQGIQSLILPTAKSKEHLAAAEVLGSKLGTMHRMTESSARELKADSKMFDKMGVHDPDIPLEQNVGVKFMSDMSQGRGMTGRLQSIADKVKSGFERRLTMLEEAGAPLENVREAYFPGMWIKESRRAFNQAMDEAVGKGFGAGVDNVNDWSPAEKSWVKNRVDELLNTGQGSDKDALTYLSRRPFKGRESFRKEKVFDDIMTGVDFGLKPKSNNPLDLVKLKYAEMDRSIMANRALRDWEAKGDVVNVDNSGRPLKGRTKGGPRPEPLSRDEWVKIADRYGEIWMRDPNTHMLTKVGERWAKRPVAEIMNNYLSSSLYNNPYFGKVYRGVMATGNLLNQSQLGWGSSFHAGFTSHETQISQGAEVLKDIYGVAKGNRTLGDLGKTVAKYPVAMVRAGWQGSKVLSEWQTPQMDVPTNVPVNSLPTTKEARVAQIAKAVELAGGKATMEQGLRTHQADKMIRDFHSGNYVKGALRSPIALSEAMMRPVMYWIVPRQKMGVFGEMAGRIIEQNPEKTMDQLTPQFRQAWNRTDARLGQVVYDRLFMNNTAKNVVQALIRSPGWSGGTIAEVGGSVKDAAKFINEWARTGKAPEDLPDRVAYTISLMTTIMAVNGALTYAFTGEKPHGVDWWAFRDGGVDKYGNPTRWLLPTYVKDIYAYWQNWAQTLVNKAHPIISAGTELWKGVNYYNEQFVDPADPLMKRTWDRIKHIPVFFEPFWTRGMRKAGEQEGGVLETLQKSPEKIIAPEFGVMPATRAYTATESMKKMDEYFAMQGHKVLSPQEAEIKHKRQEIDALLVAGKKEEAEKKIGEMREKGDLTKRTEKNLRKKVENRKGYLFGQVKDIDWAMKVFNAADPDEKRIYAPVMNKKFMNLHKRDRNKYQQIEPERSKIQTELDEIFKAGAE